MGRTPGVLALATGLLSIGLFAASPVAAASPAGAISGVASATGTPAVATTSAGPPKWLRPGVVLSYSAGQSSSNSDGTSASGGGFNQITVLHVNQREVVAVAETFGTLPGVSSAASLLSEAVQLPATDGEYWKYPRVLAEYAAAKVPAVDVIRRKYTIGSVTYDALTLSSKTVRKEGEAIVTSQSVYTYDLTSGLLLAVSFDSVTMLKSLELQRSRGLTQLAGVRRRVLPWSGVAGLNTAGSGADWKPPFRTLELVSRTVVSSPGLGDLNASASHVVSVRQQGPDYVLYSIKGKAQPGPEGGSTASAAGGQATLDLFWMPPRVLSGLRQGQQIDADPVTKRRVYVEAASRDAVTIVLDGGGQRIDVTYNPTTGIAMRTVLKQQNAVNTTTTEFTVVRGS